MHVISAGSECIVGHRIFGRGIALSSTFLLPHLEFQRQSEAAPRCSPFRFVFNNSRLRNAKARPRPILRRRAFKCIFEKIARFNRAEELEPVITAESDEVKFSGVVITNEPARHGDGIHQLPISVVPRVREAGRGVPEASAITLRNPRP